MRVLLLGGSGQLGSEIARWSDCEVVASSRAEADVERADEIARVIERVVPDTVINCTAFHNVDVCEAQPERAFAVNAVAVDRLARLCKERDATFVTISTDYVFDGEAGRPYVESDVPRPISAYGVSKLAGELLVGRLQMKAFVVRTCGLYGTRVSSSKGYTFVDRIIKQAKAHETIRIVRDVVASPTYAVHLADALRALLRTQDYGLYHAAAAGAVSWYDFAAEVLRQAGVDHPIEPIPATVWKPGTRRPLFSALASVKLEALGFAMPPWQNGIRDYLRDAEIRE
jgi:dTDP-4-dehydrorhamnose reductase